jgi:hypothetical protein
MPNITVDVREIKKILYAWSETLKSTFDPDYLDEPAPDAEALLKNHIDLEIGKLRQYTRDLAFILSKKKPLFMTAVAKVRRLHDFIIISDACVANSDLKTIHEAVAYFYLSYGITNKYIAYNDCVQVIDKYAIFVNDNANLLHNEIKKIYDAFDIAIRNGLTPEHYTAGAKILKTWRKLRQDDFHHDYVKATPERYKAFKGKPYTERSTDKLVRISNSCIKGIWEELEKHRKLMCVNKSTQEKLEYAFIQQFLKLRFNATHFTDSSVTNLFSESANLLEYITKRCESIAWKSPADIENFFMTFYEELKNAMHLNYISPNFFKGAKSQTSLNKSKTNFINSSDGNVQVLKNYGYAFFRLNVCVKGESDVTKSRFGTGGFGDPTMFSLDITEDMLKKSGSFITLWEQLNPPIYDSGNAWKKFEEVTGVVGLEDNSRKHTAKIKFPQDYLENGGFAYFADLQPVVYSGNRKMRHNILELYYGSDAILGLGLSVLRELYRINNPNLTKVLLSPMERSKFEVIAKYAVSAFFRPELKVPGSLGTDYQGANFKCFTEERVKIEKITGFDSKFKEIIEDEDTF